ncbi:hypothetical protein RJD24_13300 [Bacillaceae bacterium IKA-2]|jgi:hypothetical protein|nr:hypothetical protein RJD24_13300 [Bacillaceae bacterium IKA-2]
MSLKAIEMQVAIPRTPIAGKIQDQLQQRGQVVQDHIGMEQNKEDEKSRKQVLGTNETEKKRLNNDDESSSGGNSKQDKQNKQQKHERQESENAKHPFKGNFVDFSG